MTAEKKDKKKNVLKLIQKVSLLFLYQSLTFLGGTQVKRQEKRTTAQEKIRFSSIR